MQACLTHTHPTPATHIYTHPHTCIPTHTHESVHTHTHKDACTSTYPPNTHTHTHAHMHTQTHRYSVRANVILDSAMEAISELKVFKQAGGGTVCDVTITGIRWVHYGVQQ